MRVKRARERGGVEELRAAARAAVEELDPLAAGEALRLLGMDQEAELREVIRHARTARTALDAMWAAMGAHVVVRRVDLTAVRLGETVKPKPEPKKSRARDRSVTPPAVTEVPAQASESAASRRTRSAAPAPGGRSGALRPTREQQAIVDACVGGDDLVVEAGAGTGKTTTLQMAASAMRGRGLYLAYNRAIAQDAKRKFPQSVDCRTAHSLAWHAIGRDYQERTKVRVPARRTAQLLRLVDPLRVTEDLVLAPEQLARIAAEAVDRFAHSAADEVEAEHVPDVEGVPDEAMWQLRAHLLPYAQRLWAETQDVRSEHRFTHDYYLKMWALGRPKLGVDYVLLDEAQDANPVVAELVRAQQAQRIAVGDSAQAIYGWRGAVDAMKNWPASRRLMLQQSWRFGPGVAEEANRWLVQIGARLRLKGNPGKASVVGPLSAPRAVLCRTNAMAVARAMQALEKDKRPALVGGGNQIRALAEAALDLQAGKPTSHPELIAFSTWEQLQDYAYNESGGSDLRVFVRLVDDQGADEVVKAMNQLVSEEYADVVLSTAHKAKGREWDSVQIANDFPAPAERDGVPGKIRRDEAMLAYVAVTRAMDRLDNSGLSWLDEYDGTGDAGYDSLASVLNNPERYRDW
ncbi:MULTISPECIES: UvrD-helicase domain-containing protein [Streptomyces]|nr:MULTISPECIES: UvrD-helicase domain-containing protein [Streptomyces]AZK98779.1 DNA helicase [Streptomyces tsukubensis]EIF87917.1 DNA helicase [Streptomyces tsukubensis NRRL18488]